MEFSPRVDRRLVAAVWGADVERLSIADVWRFVGASADRLELCRPSYHAVRLLVIDERERRADRRAAIADAVEELWSFTGTDYEALATRLARTRRR